MRPRKEILLYSPDSDWLDHNRYVLTIHGYRVTTTQIQKEAATAIQGSDSIYCTVILNLKNCQTERLWLDSILEKPPAVFTPTTIEVGKATQPTPLTTDAVTENMLELVTVLHRLAIRKRGPRKPAVAAVEVAA